MIRDSICRFPAALKTSLSQLLGAQQTLSKSDSFLPSDEKLLLPRKIYSQRRLLRVGSKYYGRFRAVLKQLSKLQRLIETQSYGGASFFS